MDEFGAKATDEDPAFQRTCSRYGLLRARGEYLASNELSGWSSGKLSDVFDKVEGLPAASDTVQRPYFWQAQRWVKPPSTLIERAANNKLALCINVHREWKLLENGYVALSHVWDEGLYADARNRGLPRLVVEQLFAMLQPLNTEWLWLDSLAVPGGRRDLTIREEFAKINLINNMDNIYRNAEFVVILDALLDIALSSANRSAGDDIDYCRAFFPCLGLEWNESLTRDRGMQHIMESRREEAPSLLGMHGSPLLVEGYGWAPAYLCGLNGKPITDISWEENGLRKVWHSYRVTSNEENRLPKRARGGGWLLGLEEKVLCACTVNDRERPEAINGFKKAIENQSAFLLSDTCFETFASEVPAQQRKAGPPPTVLLVKQAATEHEAFLYMTAALLGLSAGVKTPRKKWLIYHISPLWDGEHSYKLALPATAVTANIVLPHDGESPLHAFARLSNVIQVRSVISQHCDIDVEDAAGWTALQVASHLGHLEVV